MVKGIEKCFEKRGFQDRKEREKRKRERGNLRGDNEIDRNYFSKKMSEQKKKEKDNSKKKRNRIIKE